MGINDPFQLNNLNAGERVSTVGFLFFKTEIDLAQYSQQRTGGRGVLEPKQPSLLTSYIEQRRPDMTLPSKLHVD